MTGPFADTLFRMAFVAAGIYNLAFGLWAAIWPFSFFELFEIPPPLYPGIWACLGMVVGIYGLLYLYAAQNLGAVWPIIAVGLLGKVLGPIGMSMSVGEDWPQRLGMLCVYNDLIWWLPFGLFLVRGTALGRRLVTLAPSLCVAAHVLAIAMLILVLRHGALTEPDPLMRAQFISGHQATWAIGWSSWMLAAASLVGFYAWWGSQLTTQNVAMFAVLITMLGMVCDFSGESLLVLLLTERAATVHEDAATFIAIERAFTLLSAGSANGLYTIGGAMLTLVTPGLPVWIRGAMWLTWLAGLAMTIAGVLNHVGGMVLSTAVLFPLLIGWVAWMGARWRQT